MDKKHTMKKTILPALAKLIVAAVMLSTASYAWFAMGGTVTADSMNVEVKSDSAYLVIAKTAAEIQPGYSGQSVSFSPDNHDIYPVAYPFDSATYDKFTNDDFWYTMEGTSSTSHVGNVDTKENIVYGAVGTEGTLLEDYVLLSTVYVATSVGSEDMDNLKATVTIDGDEAVNVVIVCTYDYSVMVDGVDTEREGGKFERYEASRAGEVELSPEITNTPVRMDIYVFYNGEHSTITTDNYGLGTIEDTSVKVIFSAD